MLRFIFVFLSIYSLMHALFFLRVRVLFSGRLVQRWAILFLIIMIAAPFICRTLEKTGYETLTRATAFIAFNWMGFIFLCFVPVFFMGIADFFSWAINTLARMNLPSFSGKTPVLFMLGAVMLLSVYGFMEARNLKIEELHIATDKLPPGTDSIRIVQVSDIHLGLLVREAWLKIIIEKIKLLNPDILVSTGDIVDGDIDHLSELSDLFQEIRPQYGKYAVTGNHEYYAGLEQSLAFMQKAGFVMLRGEAQTVNSLINIVGVDDRHKGGSAQEFSLLSSVQNGLFTLFLKHQPAVAEKNFGLFDLQLSGHTHGGQIFPFRLLTSRFFPFLKGYYDLPKGSGIYTNRGTGTWGPQMRILSPPEITVIELKRKLGGLR